MTELSDCVESQLGIMRAQRERITELEARIKELGQIITMPVMIAKVAVGNLKAADARIKELEQSLLECKQGRDALANECIAEGRKLQCEQDKTIAIEQTTTKYTGGYYPSIESIGQMIADAIDRQRG